MTKLLNTTLTPDSPSMGRSRYLRQSGEATYLQQSTHPVQKPTPGQVDAQANLRRHLLAYDALTPTQKESFYYVGMTRSYEIELWVYFYYGSRRAYASCAAARELLGLQPVSEITYTGLLYEPTYIAFTPHANAVEVDWYLYRYSHFTADIVLQPLPSIGVIPDWTKRRHLAVLWPTGDPQTISGISPGTYAFWLRCIHIQDGDSPWNYDDPSDPSNGYSLPYILTIPGA